MISTLQKRHILVLLITFLSFNLHSQTFVEQSGIILSGESKCSVAWVDYNNDNFLDLIIVGNNTKIYKNNGDNTFTEQSNISLIGVYEGSADWGDYDKDGYIDVIIAGSSHSGLISKIFHNNEGSSFTEQSAIVLEGIYEGSVAWGDYDNDGFLDLIISGFTGWDKSGAISKLYHNNGNNTFSEQTDINIIGTCNGSVSWIDYDNDGFLDIAMSGLTNAAGRVVTKVYHNNGNSTFDEVNSIDLIGVSSSKMSWGDYNNDGFLDILLVGMTIDYIKVAKVYRNNGDDTFTEQKDISLTGVMIGSVSWGDYDNDGDLDMILTGSSGKRDEYIPTTKIYLNTDNIFTEQSSISIAGVKYSSTAFGDYDNDGDLDICLTGEDTNGLNISKIYRNNTTKTNESPDQPENLTFEIQNKNVLLKWNRVTTDETNCKSLTYNVNITTGNRNAYLVSPHSNNNGFRQIAKMGNFQLDTSIIIRNLFLDTIYYASVQAIDNSFKGGAFSDTVSFSISPIQASQLQGNHISSSSSLLKWKRGNGDRCIVFAKQGTSGIANPKNYTTYYANTTFSEGSPLDAKDWYCIYKGIGDSVLLDGISPQKNYMIQVIEFQGINGSEIYSELINSDNLGQFSSGYFSEQKNISLTGVQNSSVAWGDFNNDGAIDILLNGFPFLSTIYQNNLNNTFSVPKEISLPGIIGSVAWGDYDNDNDLDILLAGYTGSNSNYFSKIYKNEGNNNFSEQTSISLVGVEGKAVWGDYDNDGNIDILLAGRSKDGLPVSKIYRNLGNNEFIEQSGISIIGVQVCSIEWVDYDNDGYLDIVLTGQANIGPVSKIYHNNGKNSFTEQTNISLTGVEYSSLACGDYDNDSYMDILITGYDKSFMPTTKIYHNNEGNFIEQKDIILPNIGEGSVAWGDYDNDGDLDILLTGNNGSSQISKIFCNNGGNNFVEQPGVSMAGVESSSVAWGDYDNDGDLDILLTGYDKANYSIISKIYRNNLIMKTGNIIINAKPNTPKNLKSTIIPNYVILKWDKVFDDKKSPKTMSYNLRYKLKEERNWKSAPHSLENGYRLIPAMGNSQLNTNIYLRNLNSGEYLWQVQAVDQGYQGGAWSEVATFTIKKTQSFFKTDTVCNGLPSHFTDQSVATDGIKSWLWDFKDGQTSTLQNPQHSYNSSSIFKVKLVVTSNSNEKDSLEQDVIVKAKPSAGFTADPVCHGTATVITNTSLTNNLSITSWKWDLGDGQSSTSQNPGNHFFARPGNYNTKLTVVADNGCSDSIIKVSQVGEYPVVLLSANGPTEFCIGSSVLLSVENKTNYAYQWNLNDIALTNAKSSSLSVNTPGSYSVNVTNTVASCASSSPKTNVSVIDKPSKPKIIGNGVITGICPSTENISLEVDQASSLYKYQWKRNGVPIDNATDSRYVGESKSGVYSVNANISGCSTESDDFTLNFLDAFPKPQVIAQGPSVWYLTCSNNSATYFKWYLNGTVIPGADTYQYMADRTLGSYSVSIGNEKGCFTSSDVIKIPTGTVGIEDIDPFKGLKIYPNPTPGLFTIEMDNNLFGELMIRISNSGGREILNIKFEKTTEHFQSQIDLSGQGKGMYLINLLIDKYLANRKIIVE